MLCNLFKSFDRQQWTCQNKNNDTEDNVDDYDGHDIYNNNDVSPPMYLQNRIFWVLYYLRLCLL